MRAEASGNFQQAAQLFLQCMSTCRAEDVRYLTDNAAACYAAIADWESVDRLHPGRGKNHKEFCICHCFCILVQSC